MRIVFWASGALAALAIAGCADRFRPAVPAHTSTLQPARGVPERLRVSALPSDLTWLADGLKLYREVGGSAGRLEDGAEGSLAESSMSVAPSVPTAPPPDSGLPLEMAAPSETADVRFVSLPLLGDAAQGLAAVPDDLEAAVAPALLLSAIQAAGSGGHARALPVAARWMALTWDPVRLEESPSPVPPQLEAWVDQLRALRRRRPEHPPLIAAWDESSIAGSFALLLASNGGRLLDATGRPAFAGPEGVATVELMAKMRDEGLVQPTALGTDTHRLAASLSGPYAYWLCSSDALTDRDGPPPDRLAALRLSGLPVAAAGYHYPEAATVALVQFRGVAIADPSPRAAAAWRLAHFLADPVVLRSAPPAATVLAAPPAADSTFVRQARALVTREAFAPWPEPPGMNALLGKFLHAALRRTLTPREALERAALQLEQPGALPAPPAETATGGGPARTRAPNPLGTDAARPNRSGTGGDEPGQAEPRSGARPDIPRPTDVAPSARPPAAQP